jgi:hypothetical protein
LLPPRRSAVLIINAEYPDKIPAAGVTQSCFGEKIAAIGSGGGPLLTAGVPLAPVDENIAERLDVVGHDAVGA